MAAANGFVTLAACWSLSSNIVDNKHVQLGCVVNGCMTKCTSNTYWGGYPHYGKGCSGGTQNTRSCTTQTGRPKATGCMYYFYAKDNCGGNWIGGEIHSCGPAAKTLTSTPFHGCSPKTAPLAASMNAPWADSVFGTNPFTNGHVYCLLSVY